MNDSELGEISQNHDFHSSLRRISKRKRNSIDENFSEGKRKKSEQINLVI